ncbi:MAG: Plug domain-containing protein, partial [Tannerellaceae bacterium]|nr:Plug domain-containing protein [Tannerellaceae bacterium]
MAITKVAMMKIRMTAMALLPLTATGQSFLSDSVALPDVTITADAPRQVLTQSYSQTDIPYDAIEEKIATSLIDVLEQAPGITKRGEYHSPIALRGLGGKRLLITKDGNRRMGNFSGGFMGQSVNVYDLAKVEIIKGPASVQYGPGAISGIINME